jgi:hypothetical protein
MQFLERRHLLAVIAAVGALLAFGTATSRAASTVQNPSLESDANANGVPDCWVQGGYGDNSYSFDRTSDAHSGSDAEKVSITSWSSGDRKLAIRQDSGACAPAVTPGERYPLGAWYRGMTSNVQIVAYLRTTGGDWSYWASSASLPGATDSWQHAAWTTPAVPSGYDHISFGLIFHRTGSLTTDDYSMGTAADTSPPDTSISGHPTDGTTNPDATFAFTGTDDVGLDHYECSIDGGGWTACSSPQTYPALAVGSHDFRVRAVDAAGNYDTTPASFSWTIAAPTDQSPPPDSSPGTALFLDGFDHTSQTDGISGCGGDLWATVPWSSPPCQPSKWYAEGPFHVVSDPDVTGGTLEEDSSGYDCMSGCTKEAWLHDPLPGSSQRVDIRVKQIKWGANAQNICSWAGGPKIFMGRQADVYETSTYTVEVNVCDGSAHIQKKSWGVDDCGKDPAAVDCGAGGTWYLLASSHPGAVSMGTWHTFSGVKTDNPDGSVTLSGYRDGQLVVGPVTERAGQHSLGPLRGGRVGWRSNAADWHMDSFRVSAGT